jgi:TolB protein
VVWSPDGAALAYISPIPNEAGIYLFDPETHTTQRLIRSSFLITELSWSSDSQRLFYTAALNAQSERDLYRINISTRITRNLTQGESGYVSEVVLSPDNQYLAFRGTTNDIYLMNLTDNEYKNLTDSRTRADGSADWSADGRWLAFASIENQGRQPHIVIWSQSTGFEFFAYTFSFDLAWRPHV